METQQIKTDVTPNRLLETWNFQEYVDLFKEHEMYVYLMNALDNCKNTSGFSNLSNRGNLQFMLDNINNTDVQSKFKQLYPNI